MKFILKVCLLFIAFSVEIRIHAKSEVSLDACKKHSFGESLSCVVMNPSPSSLVKKNPGVRVSLGEGAVVAAAPGVLKWVKGEGVVSAERYLEIESQFGHVICQKECMVGLARSEESLSVYALSGELQVLNFDRSERLVLDEGGALNVNLIGSNGKSGWSQPYSMTKAKLKALTSTHLKHLVSLEQAQYIYKNWERGLERYSKLYQDRASRKISSYEQGLERQRKKKAAREKEDRELRELFRKKSLLD